MNLREFSDFIDQKVEYLDEERADMSIQEKHAAIYDICEVVINAAKLLERDETTINQLRRIMNNALMNFGGGVY